MMPARLPHRAGSLSVTAVQRYDVVDGESRVVLAGTSPASLVPARGERLPADVAERVARVIEQHDFDVQPVATFLVASRLVRVLRIAAPARIHYGVWSERVSLRRLLAGAARQYGLTPHEVDTLGSVASGMHTLEIAAQTARSVTEVLADIASLKRKMACTSRHSFVERMFPAGAPALGEVARQA